MLNMGNKRGQRIIDPKVDKALKKAKERREALWTYVLIAIVLGLILYSLYLQTLHNP
jgi:uncharacterized membrane protein YwzB